MNGDFSTLATFAAAGGVLAIVVWGPLFYTLGRRDRNAERRAEDAAVSGYGRAEVPPPAEPVVEVAPEPAPDPQARRKAVDLGRAWAVDRLASMRADRSDGWDGPALDELRAAVHAARHASPDEVTP